MRTHVNAWRVLAVALGITCGVEVISAAGPDTNLPLAGTVAVKSIQFEGNSRFSDAQLAHEIADIASRNQGHLSLDDLEEARQKLTLLYINAGYINSGAILPDQNFDPQKGRIKFQIVEGKLSSIALQGRPRLRRGYLQDRIWHDPNEPLNAFTLRSNLEILRQNPNLKSINAELKPGEQPGQSALDLQIEETTHWQIGLQFDNNRPPSVGAERFSFLASDTDLLGFSDSFALRWGLTKGNLTDLEFAELDDINFSYSIPITRFDTTLQFNFENSDSPVVEEPFASLDIHSRTQTYSLGLRQPIYHTVNTEFALSLALLRRDNKNFLAGEPFSFSPGSINGQNTITAIRFGQEFLTRTQAYAFSVRSTFEFGIDALSSTTLPAGLPDSQYWLWLSQAQYVRRLPDDWQFLLRGTAQLTDQPLLPVEQFSLGGIDTVRGYRENQLVRDEALCASAELRIPIIRKNDKDQLDFALFCDAGWGKDNNIRAASTLPEEFISSAGAGILWNPSRNFSMTVYWGYPFKHFNQTADNLQDYGVHFNLIATLP